MLTKITDDLWIDFDRLVRVAADEGEVKYTIDLGDKSVTYIVTLDIGRKLLKELDDIDWWRKTKDIRIGSTPPLPPLESTEI